MSLGDTKVTKFHPSVRELRENIERDYLAKKALFANVMFILLAILMYVLLHLYDTTAAIKWTYALFFLFVAGMNFVMYVYGEYRDNVKLCAYLNTLAMYMGVTGIMIEIQTVSAFALLFLTYAVVSAYQERKTTILNHIAFLFIAVAAVYRYPGILMLDAGDIGERVTIYLLLIVFAALMSAAAFVMIKRQTFYHEQLAKINEMKLRMISTVEDYVRDYRKKSPDEKKYLRMLRRFTDALAKKINIANIFAQRIDIMEDLNTMSDAEVLEKYSDYTMEEIKELRRFNLTVNKKMRHLLFKIGQLEPIHLSKEDIYIETPLRTLAFYKDTHYTHIIAFSVFYAMLKSGAYHIDAMTDKQISDIIANTDFSHLIHPKILDIYSKNSAVFDDIFQDAMKREEIL